MRDPNRLYNFYNEVTRLHMIYRPDWRIGQFWDSFKKWLEVFKGADMFFPEEDELLEYLKEFCGEKSVNG